jgi:hypothetical protein
VRREPEPVGRSPVWTVRGVVGSGGRCEPVWSVDPDDAGELELLLSGPYREREVFVALVAGSFVLALLLPGVLMALSFGGSGLVLLWADVSLTAEAFRLLATGLVTPVPLALWATFLAVVVYLRFPDTPVNGTEPGNLLIVLGVLPAVSLGVLPTAFPSIDPLSLSVGGIVVSLPLSGPATPATTAGRAETYASDEAVG